MRNRVTIDQKLSEAKRELDISSLRGREVSVRAKAVLLSLICLLLGSVSPCWGQDVLVGRILSFQGQVEISGDEGKHLARVSQSQDLYREGIVRTGPLSRVSILLVDQSLLKIGEKSQIKFIDVVPSKKISMGLVVKAALVKAKRSLYKVFGGRF